MSSSFPTRFIIKISALYLRIPPGVGKAPEGQERRKYPFPGPMKNISRPVSPLSEF